MNADQTPEFKFNSDQKDADALYQEEVRDLRFEKLNQRITLLAILLPCLIGVMVYFGYRTLTSRVDRTQDSGAMEVRSLVKDLDSKSAELASRISALESGLTEKLTAVDKRLQAAEGQLKKTDEIIGKLKVTVADKQTQSDTLSKFENSLSSVRKELAALPKLNEEVHTTAEKVERLETAQSKEFGDLNKKMEAQADDLNTLEKNVSSSLEKKVGMQTLELELLKAKKQYQQLLELSAQALNDKIQSVEDRLETPAKNPELGRPAIPSRTPPTAPAPLPAPEETVTPPGTIQEQKIE
jgi:DNA repair exonuclease SbcCD ATPase subunit